MTAGSMPAAPIGAARSHTWQGRSVPNLGRYRHPVIELDNITNGSSLYTYLRLVGSFEDHYGTFYAELGSLLRNELKGRPARIEGANAKTTVRRMATIADKSADRSKTNGAAMRLLWKYFLETWGEPGRQVRNRRFDPTT